MQFSFKILKVLLLRQDELFAICTSPRCPRCDIVVHSHILLRLFGTPKDKSNIVTIPCRQDLHSSWRRTQAQQYRDMGNYTSLRSCICSTSFPTFLEGSLGSCKARCMLLLLVRTILEFDTVKVGC